MEFLLSLDYVNLNLEIPNPSEAGQSFVMSERSFFFFIPTYSFSIMFLVLNLFYLMSIFTLCSQTDYEELDGFTQKFSAIDCIEIRYFESFAGRTEEIVRAAWRKGQKFSIFRTTNPNKPEQDVRWIRNPYYLALIEERDGKWHLLRLLDSHSDEYKDSVSSNLFSVFFSRGGGKWLNKESFEAVLKKSESKFEYRYKADSEYFIANDFERNTVTVEYQNFNGVLVPSTIKYFIAGPQDWILTIEYPSDGFLPLSAKAICTIPGTGQGTITYSINQIKSTEYSTNDCYLKTYGIPEPELLTKRFNIFNWFWTLVALVGGSFLILMIWRSKTARN
jgi:hypothetical protein